MSVINDYLEKVSKTERMEFEKICKIVRSTIPEVEEAISYGMPAFKYKGKYLVGFYAYKNHLSLFPTSKPIEVLGYKLLDFEMSKGTIQFSTKKPIPEAIIKELVLVRAAEISKTTAKY